MGDQELDIPSNESQASYTISSYKAKDLPIEYRGLVYSKFLRSLKFGNEFFKLIDNDPFFENYHKFIDHIMSKSLSRIKIAHLSDNKDVVLGWSLIEGKVLHYVYVNKEVRKQGIAKSLCPMPIDVVTHMTTIGAAIYEKPKYKRITFNPWDL